MHTISIATIAPHATKAIHWHTTLTRNTLTAQRHYSILHLQHSTLTMQSQHSYSYNIARNTITATHGTIYNYNGMAQQLYLHVIHLQASYGRALQHKCSTSFVCMCLPLYATSQTLVDCSTSVLIPLVLVCILHYKHKRQVQSISFVDITILHTL